jgi:transcriptional regulator with XRE-family HTH domain
MQEVNNMAIKGKNTNPHENTLLEFSNRVELKYPHVAELAALRDQARVRVSSMLATLQTARKHAGLTQTAVANKLGVSQATISRWESGDEEISLRDFVFFMQACNEKMALVAAPAGARFSNEEIAREIVVKLIEQLYPELNLADIFLRPMAQLKLKEVKHVKASVATSEPQRAKWRQLNANAVRQASAAAIAASSSINNLGVALDAFNDATQ